MTNENVFKDFQNLYEVRKTVRFELIPQFENPLKVVKSSDFKKDLSDFVTKYEIVLSNFSDIVFASSEQNLNKKIKIKFSFLKTYTKREYYENNVEDLKFDATGRKKSSNQIEVGNTKKLDYLFDFFTNFEERNKRILKEIEELSGRSEENQARRSDLGCWFNELTKRTNFDFIKELFNNNVGSENAEIFRKIEETKILTQGLQSLILSIQKVLLPNESIGQVIEKASFNYYTVNKTPKSYDQKIKETRNKSKKLLKDFSPVLDIKDDGFKRYILNIPGAPDKPTLLEIERAYNLMKDYKAKQKADFLEFLSKGYSFQDLKDHKEFSFEKINNKTREKTVKKLIIYLFDDIQENRFNEIVKITNKINILARIKNDIKQLKESKNYDEQVIKVKYNVNLFNELLEENEDSIIFDEENLEVSLCTVVENKTIELKKERGLYFFEGDKTGKFAFSKYKTFCDDYKKVSMTLGGIKATIKSLEKEKMDAEKTQSWALVLENNGNRYLLTIPRNTNNDEGFKTNLQKAKKEFNRLEESNVGEWCVYKFESLTLRALDKLCFGKENNTFAPSIAKELFEKDNNFVKKNGEFYSLKRKDEIGDKENRLANDENLVNFYKTVLSLNSTKEQIVVKYFKEFDDFIKSSFESLADFERELKKTCYIKQKFCITEEKKNEIIRNFAAKMYKITSYDLQKNDKEFFAALSEKKKQTGLRRQETANNSVTNLRLDFWRVENEEGRYPIRINPEVSISFIESDQDFIKNNLHLQEKQNRRLRDRYLLTTTITENALEKAFDLSFKGKDDLIHIYENYNIEFNKNKDSLKYVYGLDRGENELVTLGVFDLSKANPKERGVRIKVYELQKDFFKFSDQKTITGEPKLAYKNLSYYGFDTHPHLYKEHQVSCIDLTTAKLVDGKIYLNGDLSTYLNLKLVAAKRKIYEYVSRKFKQNEKIEICDYGTIKLSSQIEEEKLEQLEKDKEGKGEKAKDKCLYRFDERYKDIFSLDEIVHQLGEYLQKVQKNLDDNEKVSIQKVNNLRDAICANMIGVISFLQDKDRYPGTMVLEDLKIASKNNLFEFSNTTLSSRFEQKLLQKFSSLNLVPPAYKQILSIKDNNIKQLGVIHYISEQNTSHYCPVCTEGKNFYNKNNKNILYDNDVKEYKLYGHGKGPNREHSMHHCDDPKNCLGESAHISKDNEAKCDYHMSQNHHGFDYIKSGDDLATYNIAKKGLEYLKRIQDQS